MAKEVFMEKKKLFTECSTVNSREVDVDADRQKIRSL